MKKKHPARLTTQGVPVRRDQKMLSGPAPLEPPEADHGSGPVKFANAVGAPLPVEPPRGSNQGDEVIVMLDWPLLDRVKVPAT